MEAIAGPAELKGSKWHESRGHERGGWRLDSSLDSVFGQHGAVQLHRGKAQVLRNFRVLQTAPPE